MSPVTAVLPNPSRAKSAVVFEPRRGEITKPGGLSPPRERSDDARLSEPQRGGPPRPGGLSPKGAI